MYLFSLRLLVVLAYILYVSASDSSGVSSTALPRTVNFNSLLATSLAGLSACVVQGKCAMILHLPKWS